MHHCREAFIEHGKCNAFVKRADVLPEMKDTTLLVTDIDVFKAGKPRLKVRVVVVCFFLFLLVLLTIPFLRTRHCA